ncbi:MAG: hypothetical protein HYV26_16345 [Candidatus Hydrogenedentes bacterium]|nr:hypothetical protein [Candidatus Hydrogenedentota bacterium]
MEQPVDQPPHKVVFRGGMPTGAPKKPSFAHPLFTALIPGGAGLAAGVTLAGCATWIEYAWGSAALAPGAPPAGQLSALPLLLPWISFFAGFVAGAVCLVPYRRALRRYQARWVERSLFPGFRGTKYELESLKLYWPVMAPVVLLLLSPFCNSPQQGMTFAAAAAGAWGALLLSFPARRTIYVRAVARWWELGGASAGMNWDGRLGPREQGAALGLLVVLALGLSFFVGSAYRLGAVSYKLVDLKQSVAESTREISLE